MMKLISFIIFAIKNLLELRSSGWLQGKKDAINNNDNNNNNKNNNNNLQNALNDALNYQAIKNNPQRISKLKNYIKMYNWEAINFPSRSKEWQTFEENNDTIALNILYVEKFTNKISVTYKSKYNKSEKKSTFINDW